MKKYKELSDQDLDKYDWRYEQDMIDLVAEYKILRDHHIEETTTLYAKLTASRADYGKLKSILENKVTRSIVESVLATKLPNYICNGKYVDFQGALRDCLPGGDGCGLNDCPGAHGPSGGW